jgi:hypothetical protein
MSSQTSEETKTKIVHAGRAGEFLFGLFLGSVGVALTAAYLQEQKIDYREIRGMLKMLNHLKPLMKKDDFETLLNQASETRGLGGKFRIESGIVVMVQPG